MEPRFFDDPSDFLDVAGARLAAEPVLSTVLAGVADRIRDRFAAGIAWPEGVPRWFAVVVDEQGDVLGTAMRTNRRAANLACLPTRVRRPRSCAGGSRAAGPSSGPTRTTAPST